MPFLNARVSDETKTAWRALAKRVGLSEGELLRQAVTAVLAQNAADAAPKTAGSEAAEEGDQGRGWIRLTLRPHELAAVEQAAAKLGWRRNTWLVNLVRTYVFREPRTTEAEIAALHRSNAELLAIGRNLNQIAHAMHRDDRYKESVTVQRLDELRTFIRAHVEKTQALLEAAENRWEPAESFRPETAEGRS